MRRICRWCGTEFDALPGNVRKGYGNYCSRKCGAFGRWDGKRVDYGYERRVQPDHPLANKNGQVRVHRAVLFDLIGDGTHPCRWCGKPVTWRRPGAGWGTQNGLGVLLPDHLDGNPRNNAPENLVPSCNHCNVWRSSPRKVRDDELFVLHSYGWRVRAMRRICETCGAEFLARANLPPGSGRFCSVPCARCAPRRKVT